MNEALVLHFCRPWYEKS